MESTPEKGLSDNRKLEKDFPLEPLSKEEAEEFVERIKDDPLFIKLVDDKEFIGFVLGNSIFDESYREFAKTVFQPDNLAMWASGYRAVLLFEAIYKGMPLVEAFQIHEDTPGCWDHNVGNKYMVYYKKLDPKFDMPIREEFRQAAENGNTIIAGVDYNYQFEKQKAEGELERAKNENNTQKINECEGWLNNLEIARQKALEKAKKLEDNG